MTKKNEYEYIVFYRVTHQEALPTYGSCSVSRDTPVQSYAQFLLMQDNVRGYVTDKYPNLLVEDIQIVNLVRFPV